MRIRHLSLLLPALLLVVPGGCATTGAQPKQPNILLIMADDLGRECIGAYGSERYKTPNIDRLAAEGIRFEHGYCSPVCVPTRVQILTGRYGFRTGQKWGYIPPGEKTFAHVLRAAGYQTCVAGKWQLAKFNEQPDHVPTMGFHEHSVWTWHWFNKKPSRYKDPWIWQNGKRLEGVAEKYGPDIFCDYLIDFIKRNRNRPFLAYYPMTLVHGPYDPTPPNWSKPPKEHNNRFADMVEYMDMLVGRLVKTLEDLGIRDNTLIVFTGDNGTGQNVTSPWKGMEYKGGKGTMKDAGVRVPFIANWTGRIAPGRVTDEMTDFTDIMPTLAELCGARLPNGVKIDGRSIAPILDGGRGKRDWVYIYWDKEGLPIKEAIRDKRWKLYKTGEFFDVAGDPFENSPIAPGANAEADSARARLQKAMDELRKS